VLGRTQERRDSETVVYLFEHVSLGALKVGITCPEAGGDRMLLHEKQGWTLVDFWIFDNWKAAATVERAVLDSWAAVRGFLSPDDMPHHGHTETVSLSDVSVDQAVDSIQTSLGVFI